MVDPIARAEFVIKSLRTGGEYVGVFALWEPETYAGITFSAMARAKWENSHVQGRQQRLSKIFLMSIFEVLD